MKTKKQNADFVHVGGNLLRWYQHHGRDLPFRKTRDPYAIWICEIIFQQTRIAQGLMHYTNFVARFPDVAALAAAETDEVLLYWKGLGYYSRALNLHKAAKQIVSLHDGVFPHVYEDILALPGVGKYTAAAISSICFGEQRAAVDGNFYRVLSRVFADDFDISNSRAFMYFSELALQLIPPGQAGFFNQAMMDLGSEICRPRQPLCPECPLQNDCLAFQFGAVHDFPVKTKKTKTTDLELHYYFVAHGTQFLVRQRGDDFIWKKLYEFLTVLPEGWTPYIIHEKTVSHKLTHKNLTIRISRVEIPDMKNLTDFAAEYGFTLMNAAQASLKSFPKPLENYLNEALNASVGSEKGDRTGEEAAEKKISN